MIIKCGCYHFHSGIRIISLKFIKHIISRCQCKRISLELRKVAQYNLDLVYVALLLHLEDYKPGLYYKFK
jgi:hypothetical protein